jgi:hypothetical protein
MAIPAQYSGVFSFLSASRIHYFRTVLRHSTQRQAKILRVIVIDSDGELILYDEEGDLKRQIGIASQVDAVYADPQIVVIRVADDQDVVLDFHASRGGDAVDATVRRFLSVMAAFMRADVVLERVANALDYWGAAGRRGAAGDSVGGGGAEVTRRRRMNHKNSHPRRQRLRPTATPLVGLRWAQAPMPLKLQQPRQNRTPRAAQRPG